MPALFDLIDKEPEPLCAPSWVIGSLATCIRSPMETLLLAGRYPWTVIKVEDRSEYLRALETASTESGVRPFARLVVSQMRRSSKPK